MATWILATVGIGFTALGLRHTLGYGRHGISMSLLAVLALVSGFFVWREWSLESKLSEAVQELMSDPAIEVNCQGFLREFRLDNNLGEVSVDREGKLSKTAELRSSVCSELRSWLGSDKSNPSRDEIIAVHVLSHEAVHATGVWNEGHTECLAMQQDERLAVILGATPAQAVDLANRYWTDVYPRMPNEYRPLDCREDAPLDESPDDGHWPGNYGEVAILVADE